MYQQSSEDKVEIIGIKVNPIRGIDLLNKVDEIIQNGKVGTIIPINAHYANLVYKHSWLREFTNKAEYVVSDGRGILLAARIMKKHIPEQIRFLDWIHLLFSLAEEKNYSIFLLGADDNTIQATGRRLKEHYPNLNIAGLHHGYFQKNGPENDIVIEKINKAKPHILLTGFSMPIEEQWLAENAQDLQVKVFILGAGCFEFLSGKLPTCPKWLTRLYLEWFFRLIHEPKRLFKRYMYGNPLFIIRVIIQKIKNVKGCT